MLPVDPRRYSIKEIDNIKWGIAAAWKGGSVKNRKKTN